MHHLKSIWLELKEGFEAVFRREPLGSSRFLQLYNDVHHYCTMFNDDDETVVSSPFRNGEEAFEFMGSELYCKVDAFLEAHVREISIDAIDLEGDALLRYYAAQWADYQSASQLLNLICHHLNSDWVSRELAYGHMDIHFIYELAIVKWREIVFEPVHAKLNSAALKMIKLGSKQGYCVDFELIKEVIGSYVELGKTHKSRSLVGPSLLMHLRQGSNTFAFTSWHSMLLWHLKWILMTIFGTEEQGMEAGLDLDDLWIDLKSGFEQIFSGQTVSKQRFMQLYSTVYNYCKFANIDEAALGSLSVAHFVGGQLYRRVDLFLNQQVKNIRDESDSIGMEDILAFYSTKWTSFTANSRQLNKICSFLNKHWIRREVDEERLEVRDVYELALSKWRKVVFEALSANVTTAALNLVEKSRTGVEVELSPVKVALESYVQLGTTLRPHQEPNLRLYREAFEAFYLEDTKNYFISQSQAILDSEKDFVELLTIAEEQLDIERRRARLYLHESTTKQLQSVGETVLLRGHEKFRTRSQ